MERIARESDGPVLFMLEHGTVQDMERALDLGAADFILKPFTRQELAWTLRNSSGVGKGIDKSVVQSGRDFPYIRVGGGQ